MKKTSSSFEERSPTVSTKSGRFTLIDDAINTALGWERTIALLGIDNGQYKEMQAYVARQITILLDHAMKAAYERCFTKHDHRALSIDAGGRSNATGMTERTIFTLSHAPGA